MFERFTERARQVVVLSQDEARELKHHYIGTEHILLGLLREEEGGAAHVLTSLGVSLQDARTQVVRIIGEGEEAPTGQIPFTPRAMKALKLAFREMTALQPPAFVGTEHLLLGLIDLEKGVAVEILRASGVDLDTVRAEVLKALGH